MRIKTVSFLNVNIIHEQGQFTASAYRKPTFTEFYTHLDSFLPSTYKIGTLLVLKKIAFQNNLHLVSFINFSVNFAMNLIMVKV